MIYTDGTRFILHGKSYSYAFCVSSKFGLLSHLYYGKRITNADVEFLATASAADLPTDDLYNWGGMNEAPFEYDAHYGRLNFRQPSALFVRKDGAAMSQLSFVSYRIYDGAPKVEGMPHIRKGGQTLEVTAKDTLSDVTVILNYTVSDDSDVLTRNAVIVNGGKDEISIKRAFSFCADLPQGEYNMLSLYGGWGMERTPHITPVPCGVTRIQSMRGASSHQTNPFAAFLRPDCTEDSGECYSFQLVYSGSYVIEAEHSDSMPLRVHGGIQDFGFNWKLAGGQSFTTPQALLAYSGAGLGQLSREVSRFIRDSIVNPKFAYSPRPILVNNWEATYFDFNNEKLFTIIDAAGELGLDMFVLDDGWFGKRNSDRAGLGDWRTNTDKLKGGLKPVIDRCKSRGIEFGLWFEPEMVNENSELFAAHPDYAIAKAGVEPMRSRFQLVLDMTRKEVVDTVYAMLEKVLKENDISYIKWDMNRNISELYSMGLPADRQGEIMHRYILGVYDLAERITTNFPDLFIEGCAGGGGRFDAGMLYYCPQIWTSDDTDAYERAKIQWGTSYAYPLSAMSCHLSVCPNHQTGRITPFETRGRIASLGAFGYELDLSKLTEEQREQTKNLNAEYRKISELVLDGDMYRLINPFDGEYFCEAVVSRDKSRAYVVGERILRAPVGSKTKYVHLRGLDENKTYTVQELGLTASGAALMNRGLNIPILNDFGSWTWHIQECK